MESIGRWNPLGSGTYCEVDSIVKRKTNRQGLKGETPNEKERGRIAKL